MNISIIVIGDELLIGQVVDTNSGFIARHIAPEGWGVAGVQVVADNADDINAAIDRAFLQSDVVITTGGLGPTKDDITKSVLLSRFGGKLQLDESVLANVREIFARRGLPLNKLTESQAMVPTSATVIQNRVGTAPVMWFDEVDTSKVLVAMPGVPFETREMFSAEVFPRLLSRFPSNQAVVHRTIIVEGISESALAERLAGFEESLPVNFHLAYLPKPGYIRLRLDGRGINPDLLTEQSQILTDRLKHLCGGNLLYDGDLLPEEILLNMLVEKQMKCATAESCTGGNIAHRITSIPGSSAAMLGGIVSYSNEVKHRLLGVSTENLDAYGAVSIPVVRQMVEGARAATGADVAMATSGIAGPGGGTPEKPVGTVCIAVAIPGGVISETFQFPGSRDRVIDRATTTAIIMAIRALL